MLHPSPRVKEIYQFLIAFSKCKCYSEISSEFKRIQNSWPGLVKTRSSDRSQRQDQLDVQPQRILDGHVMGWTTYVYRAEVEKPRFIQIKVLFALPLLITN